MIAAPKCLVQQWAITFWAIFHKAKVSIDVKWRQKEVFNPQSTLMERQYTKAFALFLFLAFDTCSIIVVWTKFIYLFTSRLHLPFNLESCYLLDSLIFKKLNLQYSQFEWRLFHTHQTIEYEGRKYFHAPIVLGIQVT